MNKSDNYYTFLDRVSTMIRIPYFKSMENFTIDDEEDQLYIMKKILGNIRFPFTFSAFPRDIYDNDNKIYSEYTTGFWEKYEYKGNKVYWENSDGEWDIREYGEWGYMIYWERSDGYILDNR